MNDKRYSIKLWIKFLFYLPVAELNPSKLLKVVKQVSFVSAGELTTIAFRRSMMKNKLSYFFPRYGAKILHGYLIMIWCHSTSEYLLKITHCTKLCAKKFQYLATISQQPSSSPSSSFVTSTRSWNTQWSFIFVTCTLTIIYEELKGLFSLTSSL